MFKNSLIIVSIGMAYTGIMQGRFFSNMFAMLMIGLTCYVIKGTYQVSKPIYRSMTDRDLIMLSVITVLTIKSFL